MCISPSVRPRTDSASFAACSWWCVKEEGEGLVFLLSLIPFTHSIPENGILKANAFFFLSHRQLEVNERCVVSDSERPEKLLTWVKR